MTANLVRDIWHITLPTEMPAPPASMSFSILKKLETCPRQWALEAATYPWVWGRKGYPTVPAVAAIEGTVVHAAIELITKALSENECSSLRDEKATRVLKELGGFSVVAKQCIDDITDKYASNPRVVAGLAAIKQSLLNRVPELRSRIQRHVSRIQPAIPMARSVGNVSTHLQSGKFPIEIGSYSEVDLRAPTLKWHGIADLLTVDNVECEIRDFKTGVRKPEHDLQLQIYALLWARDRDLNPSGRLATKLVLSYDSEDIAVPAPNSEALAMLEVELEKRTANAISTLQADLPIAKPSQDTCAFCSVRHMCDAYWQWLKLARAADSQLPTPYGDIEITLTNRHGPASWDGIVETTGSTDRETVLLRTAPNKYVFRAGQRIRVLNAHLNKRQQDDADAEEMPLVATMSASSEAFSFV